MKKITFITLLLLGTIAQRAYARDGYHVKVKFTDQKDSFIYLAHYFAEPMPKIYKTDSARFKNGVATFSSDQPLEGGIYMVLLSDKKTVFEFLLDNGNDMEITATIKDLPTSVQFKNSPENERFQQYVGFLKGYGDEQQVLQKLYKEAKTKDDSAAVIKKANDESKRLTAYRRDYVKKYPNTLLSNIFKALEDPEVPEGKHYLADGKTIDSNFSYNYYKGHYWDGFDFNDDRLINTPLYNGKLDRYMNKLVIMTPDSVEAESDKILTRAKNSKELFKYSLWWLTRNAEESKIMGMDEVFVYLVENYYMKGDATWLSNDELAKYIDRASKIAPNVIGNIAPEIRLPNAVTKKEESLLDLKAKYTLLIFYSPDCGHCQSEIPKIDSVYNAVLKGKGLKVYTVATETDDTKIGAFIKKNKLEDWTNTSGVDEAGDWRAKYDVYSTPTIYLLDEKKIIRGKRLDHSNIATVIEMIEKKGKTASKK